MAVGTPVKEQRDCPRQEAGREGRKRKKDTVAWGCIAWAHALAIICCGSSERRYRDTMKATLELLRSRSSLVGGGADPSLSLLLTFSELSFVGLGSVACVVGTLGVSLHLGPPRRIYRQAAWERSPHKL